MPSRPDPAPAARVVDAVAVRRGAWQGWTRANDMGLELMAAILVWTGIGWSLDRWLGTTPWLLAIGALAGNAAGIYLIWLRSNQMEGVRQEPAAPAVGDGPDGRVSGAS